MQDCSHIRGHGPQGLRRPRFSFFRFNFQTAQDPRRSPTLYPSEFQKASKLPAADLGRKLCHRIISEGFGDAPSSRSTSGAPVRRICAGRVFLSTARFGNFRPMRDFHRRRPTGNRAPITTNTQSETTGKWIGALQNIGAAAHYARPAGFHKSHNGHNRKRFFVAVRNASPPVSNNPQLRKKSPQRGCNERESLTVQGWHGIVVVRP
jgi:hypothetical protein